jgi:hypothetical protein
MYLIVLNENIIGLLRDVVPFISSKKLQHS